MSGKSLSIQEPSVTTEAFSRHGSYVRIAGELDLAYAARLEEAIAGEISRGHRHLVIDLSHATFLDCASIGSLLRAAAPLRHEPDSAIVLAGATGIVKRLLDLLHLERLFDILPDVDHAAEHASATDRRGVHGWRTNQQSDAPGGPPGRDGVTTAGAPAATMAIAHRRAADTTCVRSMQTPCTSSGMKE